MNNRRRLAGLAVLVGILAAITVGSAAAPALAPLSPAGEKLQAKYEAMLTALKAEIAKAVPYTVGLWQQTQPIQLSLVNGKNVLHFALQDGSRGVTIKDFTLTPVK
jgi:hypothetical protein